MIGIGASSVNAAPKFIGATTFKGTGSAGTMPTHKVGDLIVVVALNGATTIPTLGSGFTSAHAFAGSGWEGGTVDWYSRRVGYRYATVTTTAIGTWTGATDISISVWRHAKIGAVTATGGAADPGSAPWPALPTLTAGSWVAALDMSWSGNTYYPVGTVPRYISADNWACWADTNGGVNAWIKRDWTWQKDFNVCVELIPTSGRAIPSQPPTVTAASTQGWATPLASFDFDDQAIFSDPNWIRWDGPGYEGLGLQSPAQVTIANSVLTIAGTTAGTTGAIAYYGTEQKYGRWECRVRIPRTDSAGYYHPVALLWPASDVWPQDGEVDYLETSSELGSWNGFNLHYDGSPPNGVDTINGGSIGSDNYWHCWAVEWAATGVMTAYKDGISYFTSDPAHSPPGPMWHSFQLDWMGTVGGTQDILMEVDWLRIYAP